MQLVQTVKIPLMCNKKYDFEKFSQNTPKYHFNCLTNKAFTAKNLKQLLSLLVIGNFYYNYVTKIHC